MKSTACRICDIMSRFDLNYRSVEIRLHFLCCRLNIRYFSCSCTIGHRHSRRMHYSTHSNEDSDLGHLLPCFRSQFSALQLSALQHERWRDDSESSDCLLAEGFFSVDHTVELDIAISLLPLNRPLRATVLRSSEDGRYRSSP